METCDILVRNGYLVTMDEARNRYPDGAVAISGGGIEAIGSEWHYNCMSRSLLHGSCGSHQAQGCPRRRGSPAGALRRLDR